MPSALFDGRTNLYSLSTPVLLHSAICQPFGYLNPSFCLNQLRSRASHIPPVASAKSRDGGRTWDWGHLGYNDCYDGEYLARLELDRYAPTGQITSAVEDLALREAGLPSPCLLYTSRCV